MGIEEDGRLAGRAQPFAVGKRIRIAGAENFDVLQARLAHLLRDQSCGFFNFRLMLPIGADAGDGDQIGQIVDQRLMILLQPIVHVLHGSLLLIVESGEFIREMSNGQTGPCKSPQ